jgi:putative ABC transport system permease protein
LDPDDLGNEPPYVFHTVSADTVSPFVMSVRVRGNPSTLAARLPVLAGNVDASLLVEESRSLDDWIRERDAALIWTIGAGVGVASLALLLSAMSIFSLVSVSVSRRRREIGVRTALGAKPRQLLSGIMSRVIVIMGSGITSGGALLLLFVAKNWSIEDAALYARYLAVTSAIMLAACLLACIGPARRALRINPADALKEV